YLGFLAFTCVHRLYIAKRVSIDFRETDMLSSQERDKLREVLMAEKQRLLRSAQEGLTFAMNRERTIGRDSIDESMEEELFSTELRLRDREKWLLLKVNSAL